MEREHCSSAEKHVQKGLQNLLRLLLAKLGVAQTLIELKWDDIHPSLGGTAEISNLFRPNCIGWKRFFIYLIGCFQHEGE